MQYIQQTPYKSPENTPRSIFKSQDIFLSISAAILIHKHRVSSIKVQEQKELTEFQLLFTYIVIFTLCSTLKDYP